jgi:membrane protease YdiL (CAAX protease family)
MMILLTLLLGFALFVLASALPKLAGFDGQLHPWLPQVLTKLIMLIEAFALMFISRRKLSEYGFRRGTGRSGRLILAGLGLGATATAFILIAGLPGLRPMMQRFTFLQIVITIWIWSSVVEEIFVRGWLQTAIARQGASPRAQVLLSGAFFGALHLSLLRIGIDPASVATIVIATFLLGLVCATLRQRTGSLIAPILAHVAFNAGGVIGGIIGTIVTKLMK